MQVEVCIFDLDGTLLDSIEDIKESINEALQMFGHAVCYQKQDVQKMIGSGARTLIKRACEPFSLNEEEFEKVYSEYKRLYAFRKAQTTKPYPEVLECLKQLKQRGIRLAVLSNKPDTATKEICHYYFPHLFDLVMGAKEGLYLKPDPSALFEILHELHVDRKKAIYVGDMASDIEVAKNASIPSIAVLYGYGSQESLKDATFKISHFKEILALVTKNET